MAQKKRQATKQRLTTQEQADLIGKFSPPYLRGMRDVFKACRRSLVYSAGLQFEQMRALADALNVPFLWLLLALEGKDGAVIDLDDVDDFNAWLENNELSREQALGEEA